MNTSDFLDMADSVKHSIRCLEKSNSMLLEENRQLRYHLRVSHDAESDCLDIITRKILGRPLHECDGFSKYPDMGNLRGIAGKIIRKYESMREEVRAIPCDEGGDDAED